MWQGIAENIAIEFTSLTVAKDMRPYLLEWSHYTVTRLLRGL